MMRSFFIFTFLFLAVGCNKNDQKDRSSAQYTYGVEGWETLGSQTLIMLDAGNPSALDQDIKLTIEVVNTRGKKFIKDTTIHFNSNEKEKDFQLLMDTEGEVEKVKVSAIDA
jgi:hypothetical protein